MLQKKGESKERWGGRAEIREMEVEERGEEKELQFKLSTVTLVRMNLTDPSPFIFSVSLNF